MRKRMRGGDQERGKRGSKAGEKEQQGQGGLKKGLGRGETGGGRGG
jgi:hypothetical protein